MNISFRTFSDSSPKSLGFSFFNGFDLVSLNFDAGLENHFLPGSISPYWGGFFSLGLISLMSTVDANNWSQNITTQLSAGGLFGVEIFIFDFLSLFAEYSLSATLNANTTSNSIEGFVETTAEYEHTLDIGLGNESRIGIVIYFWRKD